MEYLKLDGEQRAIKRWRDKRNHYVCCGMSLQEANRKAGPMPTIKMRPRKSRREKKAQEFRELRRKYMECGLTFEESSRRAWQVYSQTSLRGIKKKNDHFSFPVTDDDAEMKAKAEAKRLG